jgi:hypothetical protein
LLSSSSFGDGIDFGASGHVATFLPHHCRLRLVSLPSSRPLPYDAAALAGPLSSSSLGCATSIASESSQVAAARQLFWVAPPLSCQDHHRLPSFSSRLGRHVDQIDSVNLASVADQLAFCDQLDFLGRLSSLSPLRSARRLGSTHLYKKIGLLFCCCRFQLRLIFIAYTPAGANSRVQKKLLRCFSSVLSSSPCDLL